jgi:hypothetical protein
VRRLALPLLALLVGATWPAGAEEPPTPPAATAPGPYHLFAGEVAAGRSVSSLASVTLTGWDFRLGVGGRQPAPKRFLFRADWLDSVTWLITGGLSRTRTPAGLQARGLRLGLGTRAQGGRFTLGADAEWVQVEIPRVSTGGRLLAQGIGVRLLGAFDLLQLAPGRSVMAYLEGQLDTYTPSFFSGGKNNTQPALLGGVALRW